MLQTFDERDRDLIVSVAGQLTHRDEAAVSPFDSVVQGGDAVWEGLRLYNGRIFRLEQHLARLRRSAKALAFDSVPSDEEITREIRRTLQANDMTDGVHIRLTLTRGVKITSGMDPRLNQSGPTLIVLPAMANAADVGVPANLLNVYHPAEIAGLALAGLAIAIAGALFPAGWAAATKTASALHAE